MNKNSNIKILGFNAGQIGDILIGLPAAKYLYNTTKDCQITLCVNKKYSKIVPFLRGLDYIDNIYISDGYENFPNQIDNDFLCYQKFDKIYNPMQRHSRYDWYNYYHYTEEMAISHGILDQFDRDKFNKKIDLVKLATTPIDSNVIGFVPHANGQDRSLSQDDAQFLIDVINKLGYKLIYLGLNSNLNNIKELENKSFLNSGVILSNLKRLITVDTAWSWLASGYNINTFGLYYKNYPDMIKQWSHFPENPNAEYIINDDIKKIDRQMVEQKLVDWLRRYD